MAILTNASFPELWTLIVQAGGETGVISLALSAQVRLLKAHPWVSLPLVCHEDGADPELFVTPW